MPRRVLSPGGLGILVAVVALCCGTARAGAAAGGGGDAEAGDALAAVAHYVIKVTPTLAYLDVGRDGGAVQGQEYVVLRDQEAGLVRVGRVRVIRLYDSFSIAEIAGVEAGEAIAVLNRAVSTEAWERIAPRMEVAAGSGARVPEEATGRRARSLILFGGADLSKDVDLHYAGSRLIGAGGSSGGAVGLRLAKGVSRRWRLALTYRLSGDPLGAGDVTQLSIEADAHLLWRGPGKAGPYVGMGVGLHQLTWDSPGNVDDTAYKFGLNLVGGIEVPVSQGRWSLLLEGGSQRVTAWDDKIDASNVRAWAGLGRNF